MSVHAQLACFWAGSALECQLNERVKLCRLSLENGTKPHPGCKAVELAAPSLTCSRCNLCQLHIDQPGNDIMAPWPDLQGTAALTGQSNYQQGRNRSDDTGFVLGTRQACHSNADRGNARSDYRSVCKSHFWTRVQGWAYSLSCFTQRETTVDGRPSPLAWLGSELFVDFIQHDSCNRLHAATSVLCDEACSSDLPYTGFEPPTHKQHPLT